MWSTRKRGKGQKRQKEEGKIVSVRQSSFMLFSPVSPKCVLKLSSWSIISYFLLDSYKHTASSIPEWSEPDMESVLSQKKTPTLLLPMETHITIDPRDPV